MISSPEPQSGHCAGAHSLHGKYCTSLPPPEGSETHSRLDWLINKWHQLENLLYIISIFNLYFTSNVIPKSGCSFMLETKTRMLRIFINAMIYMIYKENVMINMIYKENAIINIIYKGKCCYGCSFMLSCYIEVKDFLPYHVSHCTLAWRQNPKSLAGLVLVWQWPSRL